MDLKMFAGGLTRARTVVSKNVMKSKEKMDPFFMDLSPWFSLLSFPHPKQMPSSPLADIGHLLFY